jgi:hypothetical protein
MSFWIKTAESRWEIWMFPKLQSMGACSWLKQEPHTMQVQKFGKTSHMIWRVTFGHWGVCSMKWLHCSHHSLELIWTNYIRKYSLDHTLRSHNSTQVILAIW